jgi:hypothetical protein
LSRDCVEIYGSILTKTLLVIADVAVVPSDATDPFYTNWTKEGPLMNGIVNPIVNNTGDDP